MTVTSVGLTYRIIYSTCHAAKIVEREQRGNVSVANRHINIRISSGFGQDRESQGIAPQHGR